MYFLYSLGEVTFNKCWITLSILNCYSPNFQGFIVMKTALNNQVGMLGDMFSWFVANLKQGVIYFIKQAGGNHKIAWVYMKIPSSNLGKTCCVQELFWMSETISVHNMFSPIICKKEELLTKIYLYYKHLKENTQQSLGQIKRLASEFMYQQKRPLVLT